MGIPPPEHPGDVFRYSGASTEVAITVPHWFLALIASVLPARRFYLWRHDRKWQLRRIRGLCVDCGYDLLALLPIGARNAGRSRRRKKIAAI